MRGLVKELMLRSGYSRPTVAAYLKDKSKVCVQVRLRLSRIVRELKTELERDNAISDEQ
jgi:hypothetical protein